MAVSETNARNRRQTGTRQEKVAAAFLAEHGFRLVEMNFRCSQAEIDLIGYDRDTLVFAEVKYRRGSGSGYPQEAVTPAKQKRISRAAAYYICTHPETAQQKIRFDVVAVMQAGENREYIQWIKNAFEYRG